MIEKDQCHKTAVALEYDGEKAPFISAIGSESLAEMILQTAMEHEIPIYENKELACLLSKLELGDEIPQDLYLIIAQVLAFVYHVKGKLPSGGDI